MTAVGWQLWALLSAVFAALTAVLGKLGVEEADISSLGGPTPARFLIIAKK